MKRYSQKLKVGLLFLCVSSWIWISWKNRLTPFRGEHWAFLDYYLRADSLKEAISNVASFNCFGATRFQPLGFFPTLFPYLLFGMNFFFHYLFSLGLQIVLTWIFLLLMDGLRNDFKGKPRLLFDEYALEASLFLVLFPAADVLLWTFFHYIQTALILGYGSIYLFLKNKYEFNRQKLLSLALLIAASLIYEPFIVVMAFYLGFTLYALYRKKMKNIIPALIPLLFLGLIFPSYYRQFKPSATNLIPIVGTFLNTQLHTGHNALIGAPGATNRILFGFYNLIGMIINIFHSIFFPYQALKVNIYEFFVPAFLKGRGLLLAAISTTILVVAIGFFLKLDLKKKRLPGTHHLFIFLSACGMFYLISWGRNEDGNFASVQLRYAYLILPALFCLFVDLVYRLTQRETLPLYSTVLAMLIFINLGNTLQHGIRVREDMEEVRTFVGELKNKNLKPKQITETVMQAYEKVQIPFRRENMFFVYNARGCISSYLENPSSN